MNCPKCGEPMKRMWPFWDMFSCEGCKYDIWAGGEEDMEL